MIGLDTNVLLRFITKDDSRQTALATQVIDAVTRQGEKCFVNLITLCELIWVLKKTFAYRKDELRSVMHMLMNAQEFEIEDKETFEEAFTVYQTTNAGLADILIALRNQKAGCKHTLTFDVSAKKLRGMKRVG